MIDTSKTERTDAGRVLQHDLEEALRPHQAPMRIHLERLVGAPCPDLDRGFEQAAVLLADEHGFDERIAKLQPVARTALRMLAARSWTREELLRGLSLCHPGELALEPHVVEISTRWPVLWAQAHYREIGSVVVVARKALARALGPLPVAWSMPTTPIAPFGYDALRLAMLLAPGLVAQRRPKLTVQQKLHAPAAAKLQAQLSSLLVIHAWMGLASSRSSEGELQIPLESARRAADDESLLAMALVHELSGHLGVHACFVELARHAPEGACIELGAALVAMSMLRDVGHVDLRASTLHLGGDPSRPGFLHIDVAKNVFSIAPDLHRGLHRGRHHGLQSGHAAPPPARATTSAVGADFEVILSPDVPSETAMILGYCAELLHLDRVARLRLTRETVGVARRAGISAAEMLAAITTVASPRPVPSSVKTAVTEWADALAVGTMRAAIFVELSGPLLALDRAEKLLASLVFKRFEAGHDRRLFLLRKAPTGALQTKLRAIPVFLETIAPSEDEKRGAASDDDAAAYYEEGVSTYLERLSGDRARRDRPDGQSCEAIFGETRLSSGSGEQTVYRFVGEEKVIAKQTKPAKKK